MHGTTPSIIQGPMNILVPSPLVAALVAASCLSHVPMCAAQAAPPAAPPADLGVVVVKSAADRDDRQDAIAGKIVVTREELTRFGDTTVGDVLNRVPGVTVSGVPGRGGEIRMRGLGAGYVSILINGEPTAQGFSLDSISPTLIERIEVLRSPVADKSAQAIAGTINIILKQAIRPGQKDLKVMAGRQQGLTIGSLGGQWSDRAGAVSYSLAGDVRYDDFELNMPIRRERFDSSGQRVSDTVTDVVLPAQRLVASVTPKLNWVVSDDDTLSLELFASLDQYRGKRADQVHTLFGLEPFLTQTRVDSKSDALLARLRGTWLRTLAQDAQLEVKLGASTRQQDQFVTHSNFDVLDQLQRRRSVDGPQGDHTLTFSGKYGAPWLSGHTVSLGWDGERNRRSNGRDQRDVIPLGTFTPVNLDERYDLQLNRLALYAQDEWVIGPRWSSYLGLRWEQIDIVGGIQAQNFQNRSQVISPIVQSVWKLPDTKADQVRLALSRTFRTPNMFDLSPRRYVGGSENTPTSPDNQGNPKLKPELAWGLELAYERYLSDDAGLLSANLFARHIKDVILPDVFFDTAQGLWVSQPRNGRSARVFGLELEAKANLRRLLPGAPAVNVRGNVARNASWVTDIPGPHNRLSQQTPLTANLGADWRPDASAFNFGGNLTVATGGPLAYSPQFTGWRSVRRQLDGFVAWRQSPKTLWRLSASNVLQQSQVEQLSYTDASGLLRQTTESASSASVRLAVELSL